MNNLSYDLHIHSCLSPCGDDDMTPANIVAMAALKQLDVIAVTDHNSCKNCPAVLAEAKKYGIMAIPGMEICTIEEVHAVCLFGELKAAMEFDRYIYEKLIPVPNREKIFGRQLIYSENDRICSTVPLLLINSIKISFDHLWDLVISYGGIMFPAHIDKAANSLLSNLGFIPPGSKFGTVELKELGKFHELRNSHPFLEQCKIISNSDAHCLADIHEPHLSLSVKAVTPAEVLKSLT